MALVRVYCGLASAYPPRQLAVGSSSLYVTIVDDAGRVLDGCEIGDDSYGYAYLSALLAERATGPYSVAIAADSDQRLVPRLLSAAGWALAIVDDESAYDYTERFAEPIPDQAEPAATQRRALGLARALQAGAQSATLRPPPAELTDLKPVLAALAALATGRHAAAVALREVLRELYPAALRAYPDPADPVALAVIGELPEPGALVANSGRGRDTATAADAVASRLVAAGGQADHAAVHEAITALRVAIAETPRRGGVNRGLADTVAETVRQSVAAVRACDAASTVLVNTLAERVTASRHGSAAPEHPAAHQTSAPPQPAAPSRPTSHRAVASASPVPPAPAGPPPAAPAAPQPVAAQQQPPAPPPASPPLPPRRTGPPPVAPAPMAPPPAPMAPPPPPMAPPPAPMAPAAASSGPPANRPVSPPPPPPPGITPIAEPRTPRTPLPRRAGRTDAGRDDQVRVPTPRPAPDRSPLGSRSSWPTSPPADDWAAARSPAGYQPGGTGESTNGSSPSTVTPPWRADDLRPPEPPALRLVEPTLPEELRDELGYSSAPRSEPPPLRLVDPGRNGALPRSAPPVSADDDDTLLIFAQTRSAWFNQDDEATWNSVMDAGWQAAEQAASPTVGDHTGAGLPRRVPHANLVPGAPPRRDERPLRVVRDPASIAEHTSGYFNGWRRGQEVGGYPVGGRQWHQAAGAWEFHREEDRLSG